MGILNMSKLGTRQRWMMGGTVALILGTGLLIGSTLYIAADFPFGTTRLSSTDRVCDVEPRTAISDDGQWIGTIWIQRNQGTDGGCQTGGQAVVRWATESDAMSAWSTPTVLPLPQSNACAVHADVDIVGTTGHVAVSYWQPCTDQDADSSIRYYTCNLITGACTSGENAVQRLGSSTYRISDVRLATDALGNPQIVYGEGVSGALLQGIIKYTHRSGTTWASSVSVSKGTALNGFYYPAVAVSGDRLHIVWERHYQYSDSLGVLRQSGDVQYRYCDMTTGVCQPDVPITYAHPNVGSGDTTYPRPSIAARDGRMMLVWNICADINTNKPCESYYLAYVRSNDNGSSLPPKPREIGSDLDIGQLGFWQYPYAGTDDVTSLPSAYASHIRPVVELDHDGLPHVAWQVMVDDGQVISTTYATSATTDGFAWATGQTWQIGDGDDARVAPAIVAVGEGLEAGALHVAYLNAWLEDLGGVSASRSQVYYDYLGNRRSTIEPETLVSTHALPEGRAASVRVRVKDAMGTPVSGQRVTFSTTHGSFSYDGFGSQLASATSNQEGWAQLSVYANTPGQASVTAWLDLTGDSIPTPGEPAGILTRTWTSMTTPDLLMGATAVMPGDLITATVLYHPYETPTFGGFATPYSLWWCPDPTAPDTQPVTVRLAGPMAVNVDTWSLQNLVMDVPWEASGVYYVETRANDMSTPCDPSGRVAIYKNVVVDDQLPPGTAWIELSENRPAAGGTFSVVLRDHDPATYQIWWCPASTDSAPIAEMVGSTKVTTEPAPSVDIEVPDGVSGLYRLESHTAGGSCGNTGTRVAVSALLNPKSGVFLPLVLRAVGK